MSLVFCPNLLYTKAYELSHSPTLYFSCERTDRVSGGDINKSYALTLNTGDRIFMKANAKENSAFFTAEADLAMTELFGGFSPAFYAAYREAHPLQSGYEKRRDLYNLYHLLNHLNMFGQTYLGAVQTIVGEYVG